MHSGIQVLEGDLDNEGTQHLVGCLVRVAGTEVARFFIQDRDLDQQMPAAVVVHRHLTVIVDVDDLVRLHFFGKHGLHVFMAADAIRVAVVVAGIRGDGGINKEILVIVHVYLVNALHGVDQVKGELERALVILEHGAIERPFNNRPDVVAALPDNCVQVLFIDRPENKTE